MAADLTSEIVKGYGIDAGANAVGIAASKDFGLAPEGFKPTDVLPECLSVIVLAAAFSPEALNDAAEYTASRNAMLSAMTDMAKKWQNMLFFTVRLLKKHPLEEIGATVVGWSCWIISLVKKSTW